VSTNTTITPAAHAWIFCVESDGSPHVRLYIVNKGVGPARIETLEVTYSGTPFFDLKPADLSSEDYTAMDSDFL
jgi:hypothetical protein